MRDNIKIYKDSFFAIFMVMRVMAFEKFTPIFFFFYVVFALSLAFILSAIHWSMAVVVLFSALLLFSKSLQNFQFLKRALIRRSDMIEFADPNAKETSKMFIRAKVLMKMKKDEVQKTKLISEELIEGNSHFYLVEVDKKPIVIAYDWIIGLSPDILE